MTIRVLRKYQAQGQATERVVSLDDDALDRLMNRISQFNLTFRISHFNFVSRTSIFAFHYLVCSYFRFLCTLVPPEKERGCVRVDVPVGLPRRHRYGFRR